MLPINQIIQGDCKRVLKQLPSSCVDLIVTDPPYGVCYQDSLGRTIANDDDPSRVLGAFTDLYRILKQDSLCISFYGWSQVDAFFRAWRQAGFRPVGHIVWVKEYASRTRYLRYRHEQAYILAKGRPGYRTGTGVLHDCAKSSRAGRARAFGFSSCRLCRLHPRFATSR